MVKEQFAASPAFSSSAAVATWRSVAASDSRPIHRETRLEPRPATTMVVRTVSTRPANIRRLHVTRPTHPTAPLPNHHRLAPTSMPSLPQNLFDQRPPHTTTPARKQRASRSRKVPKTTKPATLVNLSTGEPTLDLKTTPPSETLLVNESLPEPLSDTEVSELAASPATSLTDPSVENISNGEIAQIGELLEGKASKPAKSIKSSSSSGAVTPEETAYLNKQLEKRKKEKSTATKRSTKKVAKTLKRSRSITRPAPRPATDLKDTFRAYMVEISRDALLNQSEIILLAMKIREGVNIERVKTEMEDRLERRPSIPEVAEELKLDVAEVQRRCMAGTAAKNALVAANLRLVTSVASKLERSKSLSTPGITLDDMVQEGSVGLIRAAEKFDASRGFKFSTYATWWVRAYVMRAITMQGRSIKVPSSVVDEYARIRKSFSRLRDAGTLKPTDEEVASEMGIRVAKLRFVVSAATQVPTSLDIPLEMKGDGNSRPFSDIVEGDDRVEQRMVVNMERKELDVAMRKCLRPIERAVIRLRFGLEDGQPRTFRETGELLGLSKERIRQVVFRALPKLKTPEIQTMLLDATTR